ncbi:hypothetical protein BKA67DRAFT_28938 [Truncatella angustata]|uniref:Uncharacterized protein n=1 Tax=Truncatella angustata TaxID=152316 RepID=A0A9P9A2U9_9PEZI|nr:uncharacterized protein BKA67DRAFT_28938 [Truncatella angustata]KAH6659792.1 hypothetical protein BKA67DRAFT_28938 [Truncatella angustata]
MDPCRASPGNQSFNRHASYPLTELSNLDTIDGHIKCCPEQPILCGAAISVNSLAVTPCLCCSSRVLRVGVAFKVFIPSEVPAAKLVPFEPGQGAAPGRAWNTRDPPPSSSAFLRKPLPIAHTLSFKTRHCLRTAICWFQVIELQNTPSPRFMLSVQMRQVCLITRTTRREMLGIQTSPWCETTTYSGASRSVVEGITVKPKNACIPRRSIGI